MPARTELNKPQAMLNAPQPSDDMSEAAKTMWRRAVGSRPSAEWTGADCALLRLYVCAAMDIERLNKEITKYGEIEGGKVSPRVKLRVMREAIFLNSALKLKLCPSSRYTGRDVARLTGHAKKASAALATIDGDDLLANRPKGRMQ